MKKHNFTATLQQGLYGLHRLRNRHFLLADLVTFTFTPVLALYLRTDLFAAIATMALSLTLYTIVALLLRVGIFSYFGLYRQLWRYAGSMEAIQVFVAVVVSFCLIAVGTVIASLLLQWFSLPRSLPVIDTLLVLLITGGIRVTTRLAEHLHTRWQPDPRKSNGKSVVIYGAGSTGAKIVQEIQNNRQLQLNVVAFLDDDRHKWGMQLHGVPVIGAIDELAPFAQRMAIHRVILAMPTAPGAAIRAIVERCRQVGIKTEILPGIDALLNGAAIMPRLRNVQIEDLLRRAPIQTDIAAITELVQGKRVLVTGGGGSIGRELCRQILYCRPAQLILVGHGENSIFEAVNELEKLQHSFAPDRALPTIITPVIADLRFSARILAIGQAHRPELVFHAAAHKHVPLMEMDPVEAITNNVLGTQNLLTMAKAVGVSCFIMISTDKAVNPTSVMGASKRVAELLVLQAAQRLRTFYQVVRFGNVLGSRGSVIHIFKEQIAAGGPVTVTHPDMIRYFMTIPEAVQLVLQAAIVGRGGTVMMLDMGEPVRIVDLARDLITLSGLRVEHDIKIQFKGLRPGEKLFEEMFTPQESYVSTQHEKILIAQNASHFVPDHLDAMCQALIDVALNNDRPGVVQLLMQLLPEYRPWSDTLPFAPLAHKSDQLLLG